MALTRITKGVIKPNENYDTHNINSTGIVTAIGLDINGNGDVSGNLSVGGVLTYEDVTSIDSVGIITAGKDIHVGAGVSAVGVGTFSGLDISGDIDVDGHTNLDNVSIVGVTTAAGYVLSEGTSGRGGKFGKLQIGYDGAYLTVQPLSGFNTLHLNYDNGTEIKIGDNISKSDLIVNGDVYPKASGNRDLGLTGKRWRNVYGTTFIGDGDFVDLDVDGHTNLDNVSIAGVTTITGALDVLGASGNTQLSLHRTNANTTGTTGTIGFYASDGHAVAGLYALGDGDNEGAHLVFKTTSAASGSNVYSDVSERLRITSAGSVGIGTNNPNVGNTAYPVCQVHGTSTNAYFKLTNTTTGVGSGDGVELSLSGSDAYLTNRESANIIFRTGGSNERLRITSGGKVGVGVNPTNYPGKFVVSGDALICDRDIHSRVASVVSIEVNLCSLYAAINASNSV